MKLLKPLTLSAALMAAPVSFAYGQSSGVNVAEVQNNISRWQVTGAQSQGASGMSDAAQRAADGMGRVRVLGIESVRVEGTMYYVKARVEVDTSGAENPKDIRAIFIIKPDGKTSHAVAHGYLAKSVYKIPEGQGSSAIQSYVTDEMRFNIDWKRVRHYSTTPDKVKLVGMVTSISSHSGRTMPVSSRTNYTEYHMNNTQSAGSKLPTMCTFAIKEGEALIAYHNAYMAAGGSYNRAKPQSANYDRGNEHCKGSGGSVTSSPSSSSGGWGTAKPKSQSAPTSSGWGAAPTKATVVIPGADDPLPVRMQRAFDDISLGSVRTFKLQPSRSKPNQATIRTNFTADIMRVPTAKPVNRIAYGVAVYPIGRPDLAEIISSTVKVNNPSNIYQLKTTRSITTQIKLAGNFNEINIPTDKSAYEFKPIVFSYSFTDGSKLVLMPSDEDAKAFLKK